MAVEAATIHEYFATYGWRYEYEEGSATWHTGFRGDSSSFNIFVHLTDNWLYFTICPFVNAPTDRECEHKLHLYLLRLNNAINMAKFAIDGDGDVVLSVELPSENLDYSEFADGLNAISFYADAHFVEILSVSQNPEYVPTFGEAAAAVGLREPSLADDEEDLEEEEEGGEGGEGKGGEGKGWGAN